MTATERRFEVLVDDLKDLIHDVEGLLKGIPDDLGEEAKKVRARLEATMETARHRCHQLERRALAGVRTADDWVHDRPYLVASATFGLGMLIGSLVSTRH